MANKDKTKENTHALTLRFTKEEWEILGLAAEKAFLKRMPFAKSVLIVKAYSVTGKNNAKG